MGRVNRLYIFGSICILIGTLLFAKNIFCDYKAGKEVEKISMQINKEKQINNSENQDLNIDYRFEYKKNSYMEMPTKNADNNDYLGYLDIPTLKLHLPILSDWTYNKIRKAPARYKGSVYLDDMVIMAHNYKSHFGNIHRLEIGDTVKFQDMDENIFWYKVFDVDVIEPDVKELEKGDWDLMLFTCTLGGAKRIAVKLKRDKNMI